jgi:hypothetical protein
LPFDADTATGLALLYRGHRDLYRQLRARLKEEAPEVRVTALDEFVRDVVAWRRDRFGRGVLDPHRHHELLPDARGS